MDDSHAASVVFIVESFSNSFQTPGGFHLKTHRHVARVQQGLHEQRAAPLRRLSFNELQIPGTLPGEALGNRSPSVSAELRFFDR